jgi:hypothetical protein
MMQANVPAAVADDWLDGWMFGFLLSRLKLSTPLEVLDIAIGGRPRPYLTAFKRHGANVTAHSADVLSSDRFFDNHDRRYDLVMLLSLEREACLRPLDLEDPLVFLRHLLNAAKLLKAGGVLLWSYLYCFSSSPDCVHDFFEPAAIYEAFCRRHFRPLSNGVPGVGRVTIFNSSDTLFVRHRAVYELTHANERIIRVLAGLSRPGADCRVECLPPEKMQKYVFVPPE